MGKKITKMKKKIIKPFIFMRNQPCRFTAERCRSALRQWCLNPKEMKGLSTQGSGIDQVVSVCQHFLHLQRQGKRPKVHGKQKGFKNFFSLSFIFQFSTSTVEKFRYPSHFRRTLLQKHGVSQYETYINRILCKKGLNFENLQWCKVV